MLPSSNATLAKTDDTDLCRAAAAVLCATEQTAACWLEPEPEPEPETRFRFFRVFPTVERQVLQDFQSHACEQSGGANANGWMDGWMVVSLWWPADLLSRL